MLILFGDLPKEIFKQSLDAGIVQIERFPVDQKYNECHDQKWMKNAGKCHGSCAILGDRTTQQKKGSMIL